MIPEQKVREEMPVLGTTRARRELPGLVNSAFSDGHIYYIGRRRIPMAVLMGVAQYREILEYVDDLDAALEAREDLIAGRTVSLEDLDILEGRADPPPQPKAENLPVSLEEVGQSRSVSVLGSIGKTAYRLAEPLSQTIREHPDTGQGIVSERLAATDIHEPSSDLVVHLQEEIRSLSATVDRLCVLCDVVAKQKSDESSP